MEGLLAICDREGISVQYEAITRSRRVLGLYFRTSDGLPVIVLDKGLPSRPRLERCVLAEEVGHHFTVPRGSLIGAHFSTVDAPADTRSVDELRATRWAANFLLPADKLAEAVRQGLHRVDELADWFNVTEAVVRRRMTALRQDLRAQHQLTVRLRDLWSPLLVEVQWGTGRREAARRI